MTDHAATLALVDAMKARGVRSFNVGDVRVEFGPVEAQLAVSASVGADEAMCNCGCPMAGHMNGACVTAGCHPSKCAEKPK